MKKLLPLTLLTLLFGSVFSQSEKTTSEKVKVYGTVKDEKDSVMMGVTVVEKGTTNGTQTDIDGKYSIELPKGTHTLEYSYIGYTKRNLLVTVIEAKEKKLDVSLQEDVKEMDIVVVTGSKYEKKLSEEVVSMEVLKASVINQNSAKMV